MPNQQNSSHNPITFEEYWNIFKGVAPYLFFLVLLYCMVVPMLWPQPKVQMIMTDKARLGEDIALTLKVSAWHSNFRVTRVRFQVDPLHSSAIVEQAALYPIDLRDAKPRTNWPEWSMNRITWPRTRSYNLTVPLSQSWREGLLQAGVLQGTVWVTVETPRMGKYNRSSQGGRTSNNTPQDRPFAIQLTPSAP